MTNEVPVRPSALDRRELLRLGCATAVAVAASSVLSPVAFAATETGSLPLLSIGFTPDLPVEHGPVRLIGADRILMSDASFLSRGAKIGISSFSRAARNEGRAGGVSVDAVFPVRGVAAENYPKFRAFSFVGHDPLDMPAAISFPMPVTADDGVQLLVRRTFRNDEKKSAPGGSPEQSLVSLGINSGATAKLQRGAYVFTFRESDSDYVPEWNQLTLSRSGDAYSIDSTNYSYVVVTVDYQN